MTTCRSFITYILALPSFTYGFRSYGLCFIFCGSFFFSNRSFFPLSVHQLCRLVIVRYVHSLPRTWTGLDWTLVMVLLVLVL
ncbi:hypothetical protein DFH94DRAFT_285825 [Russula ochroleuca]|uniref:Uncharacterized protein n=1 Tax=Russula ochroleuca TaxID=152965 RepID=A0A9P5MP99_9AGAM|nr:hypothetical protein DFH94DRAFT_285825 [Russula ochroleuca]